MRETSENDFYNSSLPGLAPFVHSVTRVVRQTGASLETARCALTELARFTGVNALLCDTDGKVLAEEAANGPPVFHFIVETEGVPYVDKRLLAELNRAAEPEWNLRLHHLLDKAQEPGGVWVAVAPVISKLERFGALFLYKPGPEEFGETHRLAAELAAAVAALGLSGHKAALAAQSAGSSGMVKASLDTLSYSELTAVIEIFKELSGLEGRVVASQVAKRCGVTRSAIVNALRKLESASIVESRSLGVKGTYIKVNNESLLTELAKFR